MTTDHDARWKANLERYRDFRAREGRDPKKVADDSAERSLGTWLSRHRQAARNGKLSRELQDALVEVNPNWCPDASRHWRDRLNEYAAFRAREDRDPLTTAVDHAEKTLVGWLGTQRTAARRGKLSQERQDALAEVNPDWCPDPEQQWRDSLSKYAAFRTSENRDPSAGANDAAEKTLGVWLTNQRSAARRGKLSQERQDALAEVNPDWRPDRKQWVELLAEYIVFRARESRDPSTSANDHAEKALGSWLVEQRKAARRGKLSQERQDALAEVNPDWCPDPEQQWRDSLSKYAAFRTSENRDPSTSTADPAEKTLRGWLGTQRTAARRGKLSQERQDALAEVNPDWCPDPEQQWRDSLSKYAAFRTSENRDPSTSTADPAERTLGGWLGTQRYAARNGDLSKGRQDALDGVNPYWRVALSGQGSLPELAVTAFVRDVLEHMSELTPMEVARIAVEAGMSPQRARIAAAVAGEMLSRRKRGEDPDLDAVTRAHLDREGTDPDGPDADEVAVVATVDTDTAGGADDDDQEADGNDLAASGDADIDAIIDTAAVALERIGKGSLASADVQLVEFLTAKAAARMWEVLYHDDSPHAVEAQRAKARARAENGGPYHQAVAERFLRELDAALDLPLPDGWAFRPPATGLVTEPNLMQRHVATLLRDRGRIANFSGTGSGKTVSAVLGARVCGAGEGDGVVLVLCPLPTVDGWKGVIESVFADNRVSTSPDPWRPTWRAGTGPRWVVANFDRLTDATEADVAAFCETHRIDMVIIDEGHYIKARERSQTSARRRLTAGILTHARERNQREVGRDVRVLLMTATPVVNDLAEPTSLLDLVTGETVAQTGGSKRRRVALRFDDIAAVHDRLVRHSVRFRPAYFKEPELHDPKVDATRYVDDLIAAGADVAAIERILVRAKLPVVVAQCLAAKGAGRRTLVYAHYVDGIVDLITEALVDAGLTVAAYTGSDHTGLDVIRQGGADVLVASSAAGTGVDGLQTVCQQIVFASLPWTHAAYEQVVGRVWRQGQTDQVNVVIPMAYVERDGADPWEYDRRSRLGRVVTKRDLASVVVDGHVPDRLQLDDQISTKALQSWLDRLTTEGVREVPAGEPLDVRLSADTATMTRAARARRFSELSTMNGAWGSRTSQQTHRRLTADPTEWHRYHDLYREAAAGWGDNLPVKAIADDLATMGAGWTVADLGCGECRLADELAVRGAQVTLREFDHVAARPTVTVADISLVPLDDGSVNAAVLSLALMGSNHTAYISEAWRIVRPGGYLWLAEPTSAIGADDTRLRAVLADYGFSVARVTTLGQFTLVLASRLGIDTGRRPVIKATS